MGQAKRRRDESARLLQTRRRGVRRFALPVAVAIAASAAGLAATTNAGGGSGAKVEGQARAHEGKTRAFELEPDVLLWTPELPANPVVQVFVGGYEPWEASYLRDVGSDEELLYQGQLWSYRRGPLAAVPGVTEQKIANSLKECSVDRVHRDPAGRVGRQEPTADDVVRVVNADRSHDRFALLRDASVGETVVFQEAVYRKAGVPAVVEFLNELCIGGFPPDAEARVFVGGLEQWATMPMFEVDPGIEFVHGERLLRFTEAGKLEWIVGVDPRRIPDALAPYQQRTHRVPDVGDVVQVLQPDGTHDRFRCLAHVVPGHRLIFQGATYETQAGPNGLTQLVSTGQIYCRVVETFQRTVNTIVDLTLRDDKGKEWVISGTPEHPFFVPAVDEYIEMGRLQPGTQLETDDGSIAFVATSSIRHGEFKVYNFEVEGAHNYFVAGNRDGEDHPGVLVHNFSRRAAATIRSVFGSTRRMSNQRLAAFLRRQESPGLSADDLLSLEKGLVGNKFARRIRGEAIDLVTKARVRALQNAGMLSKRVQITPKGGTGPDFFWSRSARWSDRMRNKTQWMDMTTPGQAAQHLADYGPATGQLLQWGRAWR